jgi:hypothetical protein
MKFTIGGVPFTFDLQGGQASPLSKKVSVSLAKASKEFWIPVAGPLGANVVVSAQAGISADASVNVKARQEELPGPYASPAYRQTATIGGTLAVGPSASGSVFVGAGAGARAANVSAGVAGKLSATGSASATLEGSAMRNTFDTPVGGWSDWSGAISMPITMNAGITADLSTSVRWNFVTESGEWFSIKLGSYPVATAEVKCTARAGIPGGEDLSDVSTKFEWMPPVVDEVKSGTGKPPWEGGGGAEGAGPGTEPSTSGGAGGAPSRSP